MASYRKFVHGYVGKQSETFDEGKQNKWLSEIEFNDRRDARVFAASQKAKIKPNVRVFLVVFVSPTHYDIAGERRQREEGKEKQKSICNIKHKHFLFDGIASLAVIYASWLPFDSRVMRSGFPLSRTLKGDVEVSPAFVIAFEPLWTLIIELFTSEHVLFVWTRPLWPGSLSSAEWHTLCLFNRVTSWPTKKKVFRERHPEFRKRSFSSQSSA